MKREKIKNKIKEILNNEFGIKPNETELECTLTKLECGLNDLLLAYYLCLFEEHFGGKFLITTDDSSKNPCG